MRGLKRLPGIQPLFGAAGDALVSSRALLVGWGP